MFFALEHSQLSEGTSERLQSRLESSGQCYPQQHCHFGSRTEFPSRSTAIAEEVAFPSDDCYSSEIWRKSQDRLTFRTLVQSDIPVSSLHCQHYNETPARCPVMCRQWLCKRVSLVPIKSALGESTLLVVSWPQHNTNAPVPEKQRQTSSRQQKAPKHEVTEGRRDKADCR